MITIKLDEPELVQLIASTLLNRLGVDPVGSSVSFEIDRDENDTPIVSATITKEYKAQTECDRLNNQGKGGE